MGKKRRKNGKHLFLHGAWLLAVLLLSAGCATISDFQRKYQEDKRLQPADNLATKGDYEGALKAYEDVVKLSTVDSPGDKALFRMGLIWAHPDNPERDDEKALKYFQQLPRDFPRSPLKDEARAWVSTINELIRCKARAEGLEEAVSALRKQLNASKEEAGALEKRLQASKEEVSALTKRLNALKEIDIGIEEKKRKDLPRE